MTASTRSRRWTARNVTAVLGPTNTGKTHLAIERLLGHESGMIGLPLRLLAREVYGRVVARAGADQVALVTGEEKILPARPRYWVSTVEAMPRETDAAFVAIDEVQLAGDLERGHVFTDRLLNLRGTQETLLLGAATMRGIVEKLLPGIHVVTRPRMSVLAYAGQKKLTRLPERSAIVAFSADEVYAVGELIRRQRGGAAVVLGALSPRTRNKQVELYQSGDVDFIVATDAIGMGLNLDLDHVAFAAQRKYDGYQYRDLSAAELGQIAGRAGRHMRDGTFGVTGRVDPFPDPLVEALEQHRFEPVRTLQWRNDALDFSSLAALRASLDAAPQIEGLTKAPPADDQVAFETLSRDAEVVERVTSPDQVRRLWEACRLPDYRKIAPAQHAQLIAEIFGFLADGGVVPNEWIAAQVSQANRVDGDIDTLSSRIAQIRTFTFVANQPDWLAEAALWREETKAVEDNLSDALHEHLTKRFVDRRTSVLMRRLRENTVLEAEIAPSGDVLVEGHHIGALHGFRFTPDPRAEGAEAQTLRGAAQKALLTAIHERAERIARAGDREIVLSLDGAIRWQGEPVAKLAPGDAALRPRIVILADDELTGPSRELVERRLAAWLTTNFETHLRPLLDLTGDSAITGMARGVAFRLVESFGILERREVADEVRGLDQAMRGSLRRHGVRFGAYHIYVPALLKPGPSTLLAQLWALADRQGETRGLAEMSAVSASGRTSVTVDPAVEPAVYRRFGFRIFGNRAVRIDILERLADLIRPALAWTPDTPVTPPEAAVLGGRGFVVTPPMTSLLGASGDDLAGILSGLGYRMEMLPRVAVQLPRAEPPAPAGDALSSMAAVGEEHPALEAADALATDEASSRALAEANALPAVSEPAPAAPADAHPSEPLPADAVEPSAPTAEPAPVTATPDDATEPQLVAVWRLAAIRHRREPRPSRPPRAARRAAPPESEPATDRREAKPRPKRRERDQRRPPPDRPPLDRAPRAPRERPVDPDSPFAALAALKSAMEKSGQG
jgi:ATP-dependent RNA helicase SUPV3L1/SUV3